MLGHFDFDLYGYVAYAYSLAVLFVLFVFARRLIHSPFGLSLRGIRENASRMPAIGAPSRAHIRTIYTISAAMAGIAGACWRRRRRPFRSNSLGFRALGRRAGHARSRRHRPALRRARRRGDLSWSRATVSPGIEPQYWYFWIGVLLVTVVMFLPNGILGGLAKLDAALEPPVTRRRCRRGASPRSFGSLVVAEDIAIDLPAGVRYALIGPNGAGKTTLINLMTGMLRPDAGAIFLGRRRTSPRCRRTSGCGAGWFAPIRSIRCFRISPRWNR